MSQKRVLFVCVHNSARSQMAEAFLNHMTSDMIAESAGLEPGTINPLAIAAMQELGINISQNNTDSVFEFYKRGKLYNYIITVCDEANAQKCPVFPGIAKRIAWSFKDPSTLEGTHEEKLDQVRKIRDEIKSKVEAFVEEVTQNSINKNNK